LFALIGVGGSTTSAAVEQATIDPAGHALRGLYLPRTDLLSAIKVAATGDRVVYRASRNNC
jgi:hypothetical protein